MFYLTCMCPLKIAIVSLLRTPEITDRNRLYLFMDGDNQLAADKYSELWGFKAKYLRVRGRFGADK